MYFLLVKYITHLYNICIIYSLYEHYKSLKYYIRPYFTKPKKIIRLHTNSRNFFCFDCRLITPKNQASKYRKLQNNFSSKKMVWRYNSRTFLSIRSFCQKSTRMLTPIQWAPMKDCTRDKYKGRKQREHTSGNDTIPPFCTKKDTLIFS